MLTTSDFSLGNVRRVYGWFEFLFWLRDNARPLDDDDNISLTFENILE